MGLRHRDVLSRGGLVALALFVGTVLRASVSHADDTAPATSTAGEKTPEAPAQKTVIGPVLTTAPVTEKSVEKELRKVIPTDAVAARAREVEIALRDAAQDLGLEVDLGAPLVGDGIRELDLVKAASTGHWVISPRIESAGGSSFTLRIVAVPPKSSTLLVRIEKTDGIHIAARAVVMLRDFVNMKLGASTPSPTADDAAPRPEDEARRSRGRPVLAASMTLFGLYTALSIHRTANSDDPRLLYPLLALGSGIGLGASLLAAEEWNVTTGSAWTIAAGSWWGVLAGVNIAAGRENTSVNDRYAWGLGGGLIGTGLAIGAVGLTRFDDGDATITHSGAALGTFAGGILHLLHRGTLKETPATGLGYGAAGGLVAGGILAAVIDTSAQRVMMVDLGAGLGALGGAALASPLVVRNESPSKTRWFLGGVLGGTVLGGGIAWMLTRDRTPAAPKTASARRWVPLLGPDGAGGFTAGLAGMF